MIGTGSILDPALGLLLALGQVPADLPEWFAAVGSLRRAGVSRTRRLLLAAAFAIPVLVGATAGYCALRTAPDIVTLSILALTGRVRWRPSSSRRWPQRRITGRHLSSVPLFFAAGFALFAAISVYGPG